MKEVVFGFERLKVYQAALDFIDKIFRIYKGLPEEYKHTIGDNLVRAGISVANNLAEDCDKESHKERARYYATSSDSVKECISVFNTLKRQNLINEKDYCNLRKDGKEITSMIIGLINSL